MAFAKPKNASQAIPRDALVGCTIVLTPHAVTEEPSKFNPGEVTVWVEADLTILDGTLGGQYQPRWRCPGAMAKVIRDGLEIGETAPAKVIEARTKNGNAYVSLQWLVDPKELTAAEKKYAEIAPKF